MEIFNKWVLAAKTYFAISKYDSSGSQNVLDIDTDIEKQLDKLTSEQANKND